MKKIDLSKYDNHNFHTGANGLQRAIWYFTNLFFFQAKWNVFSGLKVFLLRLAGARIGKGVVIKPGVNIKFPWKLVVKNHVWVGENVWIDNLDRVTIESHCVISQGAMLLCGNHNYKSEKFDLRVAPISLKEGCWIGAQSVVTAGVSCGKYSVLSVASVAQQNLQENTIYQGNPAQAIRKRFSDYEETQN